MTAPQVWAGSAAEPGDDVTHVRDFYGVVWHRRDGVWWADIGHGYDDYRQWHELLYRGPLTDATGESQ